MAAVLAAATFRANGHCETLPPRILYVNVNDTHSKPPLGQIHAKQARPKSYTMLWFLCASRAHFPSQRFRMSARKAEKLQHQTLL